MSNGKNDKENVVVEKALVNNTFKGISFRGDASQMIHSSLANAGYRFDRFRNLLLSRTVVSSLSVDRSTFGTPAVSVPRTKQSRNNQSQTNLVRFNNNKSMLIN